VETGITKVVKLTGDVIDGFFLLHFKNSSIVIGPMFCMYCKRHFVLMRLTLKKLFTGRGANDDHMKKVLGGTFFS